MSATLNIAFCISDNLVSILSVTVKSIIETHRDKDIHLHILSDRFSTESKDRLMEVINDYPNIRLNIHLVQDDSLLELGTGHWTKYTWYRILIPQYLTDIERVLYLDADTLVAGDISELFKLDMTDRSIASTLASQAFQEEPVNGFGGQNLKYICAGVLFMNLNYWREHRLTERIINWAKQNNSLLKWPDQDAINYICEDSKIILPLRYGIITSYFLKDILYQPPFFLQLYECVKKPAIIHYVGGTRPWFKDSYPHLFKFKWDYYNRMLKHPVEYTYEAKGFTKIKIMIWNILFGKRRTMTVEEVWNRLSICKDGL